ncbi:MAG: tetratricopeptide repeat protein [bacterium]
MMNLFKGKKIAIVVIVILILFIGGYSLIKFNLINKWRYVCLKERELKELINKEPKTISDYITLGHMYISHKEYDKAIKSFEEAKSINPNNPDIYMHLANAYCFKEKFNKAIKEIKKAMKIDSSNPNIYMRLADIYGLKSSITTSAKEKESLLDKALTYAEKSVNLSPNDPFLHHQLGFLYEQRGLLNKALISYKKAIKISNSILAVSQLKEAEEIKNDSLEAYNRVKKLNKVK